MKAPKIVVGTEIEWTSAAGHLVGTVKEFALDWNAAGEMVPWIWIEDVFFIDENGLVTGKHSKVQYICATHQNLVMLKVKVKGIAIVKQKTNK